MARRPQRAVVREADAGRADPGGIAAVPSDRTSGDEHLVGFQVANGSFGFRLADVGEIVRLPGLVRMPLGPRSLLGLANLRGAVLPVVSLRRLLGLPDGQPDEATRVIVIGRGSPVGFVVDRIDDLLELPADRVETDGSGAAPVDPDVLDGVVGGADGDATIRILDPRRLLRDEFGRLGTSGPHAATGVSIAAGPAGAAPAEPQRQVALLCFDLGPQEYGLPLDHVREIISLPDHVSEVPRSETSVLGVVGLRDRLLPLVSLRALLGLPGDADRAHRPKVIVLSIGSSIVGVVADRTREILRVDPGSIEPAPALLARGAGDAEITSICRLDGGRRLVAVLSPDRLFRSDLVRRVVAESTGASDGGTSTTNGEAMTDEQFIIFRLGDQEYGMPIAAVDEVARRPDHVTRLPRAPAFVDGVMNLRGGVVPIVDLRRRFEISSTEPGVAQRILVLSVGGGRTGFMVDRVTEVIKVPAGVIRPAPELSAEQMRLIGRVANLEAQGRMILLIDPAQLLDQVEAAVLVRFDRGGLEQPSTAP